MVSVEATVKTNLKGHPRSLDLTHTGVDPIRIEINRLFAKYGSSGSRRCYNQVRVRVRTAGDEYGVNVWFIKSGIGICKTLRAVGVGQLLHDLGHRVNDISQCRFWVGRNVASMNLADHSGAE